MGKQMTGDNLSHLIGGEIISDAPSIEDISQMAGGFLQLVAMSQDIPHNFDGCAMNVKFEPNSRRLLSISLSPIDLIDGAHIVRDKQVKAELDAVPESTKMHPLM